MYSAHYVNVTNIDEALYTLDMHGDMRLLPEEFRTKEIIMKHAKDSNRMLHVDIMLLCGIEIDYDIALALCMTYLRIFNKTYYQIYSTYYEVYPAPNNSFCMLNYITRHLSDEERDKLKTVLEMIG